MSYEFFPLKITRDWDIIRSELGCKLTEDTKGIVVAKDDEMVGAVIFQMWSFTAVQCHWWLNDPMILRHGFLEEVYRYIFIECGLDMLIGLVAADNKAALKLDKHIGFKEVFRVPNGWKKDIDQVVLIGTREDFARWAPEAGVLKEVANG